MKKTLLILSFSSFLFPAIAFAGVDPFLAPEAAVSGLFSGAAATLLALISLLAGIVLSCCCCMKSSYAAFALALIIGVGDNISTSLASI